MRPLVERHNRDFALCHRCWFEAVYKDKHANTWANSI